MTIPLSVDVFDNLHDLLRLYRIRMRKSVEAVHPELTFNEMRILMHAGRRPGITQKDLVEHSQTDKAQMARTLARLQEQGWLSRSPSENDRRVRCLRLSAQGRQLYMQLRSLQEQVATELLRHCPSSTQAQLLALLRQAHDSAQAGPETHDTHSG